MTESPLVDSSFAVPVFSLGDDPISCLNKAMAFLTAIASSSYKSNATSSGKDNPKRPRNAAWYKDKAMLAEAQEAGQILDEEQLAFLVNPGVPDGQVVQKIIPNNAAFQTKDLDTYDSDCDDISNSKAVLMANISIYGFDVISGVPHSETYLNDMKNQSYPNPFYLKTARRIKPTLYNGIVIFAKHVAMHVIDDEETLILEEDSRSKKSKKRIHIDYEKLSILSEDFGKRFTPKQELSAKQAFWFRISNPTIESSNKPRVKVEVPSELPKASLVNASLKKLKFYLAQFDSVVKKRTTPNARTEDQFDLIKKTCVRTEEHSDSLIDKLNLKSTENEDLKDQIQDKAFVITSLKNDLQKVKGKEIVNIVAQKPSANTIVPGMFKLDLDPLAPKLLQNREAHIDYLKYTQEQTDIL
uniref:Retrovirus-related Pol polyprotein from transposon TNT 1-94 n=1 Tax=Tanacetum cinerariifolium TaxID=118510 RepID=A0A6L2J7K7_TANCI|nr:hypothetical protein [Tanacetum cinerariifolium]